MHFELIFVQGDKHESSFNFLHADVQFSQKHLLEEAAFSPSCVFGALVKNQVGVAAWIHGWVFYLVPLVFMSVFVPIPHHFSDLGRFPCSWEVTTLMPNLVRTPNWHSVLQPRTAELK
jgi:hypothetical protein